MKKNSNNWIHQHWYVLKKAFFAMKLTALIFLISTLSLLAGESYSQNMRISMNMKNVQIKDLLQKIETNTEYFFIYNNQLINVDRLVTVQVKNERVKDVLASIFKDQDVEFQVSERKIVIAPSFMGQGQQQKAVSGKVTDTTGASLPGVTVMVKGTNSGSITDGNGLYTLTNISENAVLQFSFVGMKSQELAVSGKSVINVTLQEEAIGIEEVVAVGYGVQKKSNVSGSITSVSSKDLHSMATNDAGQALQGKAPVFAARNSGKPGEGTSIFLRGVGTMRNAGPLWIIDGIQGAPLDNFNDVESIQILKDAASTAIYGVQAANGVILVTTKKARKGKISINYNGYVRVNNAMGLPELLDTQDYIDIYKSRYKSNNPTITDAELPTKLKSFYFLSPSEVAKLPNTKWVDEIFRTGLEQVHSVTIAGGNEKSTYMFSLMNENDEGTVIETSYEKSSIKMDFTQQATNWLKLAESISYRHLKRVPFFNEGTMWQGAFRGNPAMNVYDATNPFKTGYGYFADSFANTVDWQGGNPVEDIMTKDYWEKSDQVWANLQAVVTPTKGLTWTNNVSGNLILDWSSKFKYNSFGGVSKNNANFVTGTPTETQFAYSQKGTRWYLIQSYLSYDKNIGKNDLSFTLGTEVWESGYFGADGSARYGIPSQDLRSTQLTSFRDGYNNWGESSRYSQMGRFGYSYDNRYLLTATFRNDATDNFAPGKRQAFFPGLSVGWNLANEPFFKSKINELKLRFGTGASGNSDVPANLWRQEYALQTNGTWASQKVVNNDITWEETVSTNLGIDLGVWENALTATIDVYNKETRDALLNLSIPSTTGFSSYYINKGVIRNRGVELTVGARKTIRDFNFSVNANVAYNENKVLDIGSASYLSGGNYNRTLTNGPVSAFFGYVADGLYQTQAEIDGLNANAVAKGFTKYDGSVLPGDIKFKDLNGDGTITSDKDQTTIGSPWPKYVFGANLSLAYKGIDMSMNWQGVADVDIYNGLLSLTQNMNADWNTTHQAFNAWSPTNTGSTIPRLGNSAHNFGQSNSYMIESGAYLRLKNIQVGYNFSKSWISKIKMQNARIYLGMENALTFTKFSGFDPEFMSGNNYSRGVYGVNQYPQSRSIVFGIQVGI